MHGSVPMHIRLTVLQLSLQARLIYRLNGGSLRKCCQKLACQALPLNVTGTCLHNNIMSACRRVLWGLKQAVHVNAELRIV